MNLNVTFNCRQPSAAARCVQKVALGKVGRTWGVSIGLGSFSVSGMGYVACTSALHLCRDRPRGDAAQCDV